MEMRFRALLTSIVVLATISLVGCGHYTCGVTFGSSTCTPSSGGPSSSGGGGTQTAAPVAFVYFADDNNGNIGGAGFDALGNFDALSNFTAPTFPPGIDGGMVIAQKKWLYMPVSNLLILGFSIDGTSGTLTALPGSPFVNPTANAFSITSDPKGQFLFITGDTTQQVSAFAINQTDGTLTYTGTYAVGVNSWDATTDGQGRFLYVAEGVFPQSVAAFSIGTGGALTAVAGSPFPAKLTFVRGEATGKFLLGVSGETGVNGTTIDDHVYVYGINQTTGAIAQVAGSPFASTFSPYNLVTHPVDLFVYTFNESSSGAQDPMEGFEINSTTGELTEINGLSSFAPSFGMFDQSGSYLFTHGVGEIGELGFSSGSLTSNTNTLSTGSNFAWAVTDTH